MSLDTSTKQEGSVKQIEYFHDVKYSTSASSDSEFSKICKIGFK